MSTGCELIILSSILLIYLGCLSRDTATVRKDGETPNDRNDRGMWRIRYSRMSLTFWIAIRNAVAWYNSHISLNMPAVRGQTQKLSTVILVTDDAANRDLSGKEGVKALSGMLLVHLSVYLTKARV